MILKFESLASFVVLSFCLFLSTADVYGRGSSEANLYARGNSETDVYARWSSELGRVSQQPENRPSVKPKSAKRADPQTITKGNAKGKKSANRLKAQKAVVATEGAAVYSEPDFDSRPLTFLSQGKKVTISQKTYPGRSGIGIFHRIRYTKKALGYIADIDVVPEFKKGAKGKKRDKNPEFKESENLQSKRDPEEEQDDEEESNSNEPIYFRKWIGGSIGTLDFGEKFQGETLRSSSTVLGFKLTGPDLILSPPLDFNLYLGWGIPSYYEKIGVKDGSGLFIVSDLLLPIPLLEWGRMMLTVGLGPMLSYTRFNLKIRNSSIDSHEVRIGLVLGSSLSFQVHRNWLLRVEPKYYWEKTKYWGFLGSVQTSL